MKKELPMIEKLTSHGMRLFYLSIPFLILVFVFNYLPLYGWVYAFFNYRVGLNVFNTPFVGLSNFVAPFRNPILLENLGRVIRNTLAVSFLNLSTSFLPVLFAILLSEIRSRSYKKIVQTFSTMPNFISWVIVYALAYSMFAVDDGFINGLLMRLGLITEGIHFMRSTGPSVWFMMLGYQIWKSLGWSAIIYLATITSISQELYEAARVDGANRFQLAVHVTLPGVLPTYFVLLVLSIASIINSGMDQYYVFSNPINREFIEVLDLYVYNTGMVSNNIPYATAVGMMKTVVSTVLLFTANSLSRLVRGESVV